MKKITNIILFLLAIPDLSMAQSTMRFYYDNAGNRILQEVVYDNIDRYSLFGDKSNGQGDAKFGMLKGQIGGHIVRTSQFIGELTVEILGLKSTDNSMLSIYNITGQQLFSESEVSTRTTIDTSSFSDGVYILQICVNNEKDSWKIIKK